MAVVLSSDHGELLGAHGGLHQKWYNAFEETLRVPLIVRAPWLQQSMQQPSTASPSTPSLPLGTAGAVRSDVLTTHLDLVPTLLGLAIGSSDPPPSEELPGRNLLDLTATSPHHDGGGRRCEGGGDSYFVTFDHVLDGSSRHGNAGRRWPALGHIYLMRYPGVTTTHTAVESVVGYRVRSRGATSQGGVWKIVRTFDPARVLAMVREGAGQALKYGIEAASSPQSPGNNSQQEEEEEEEEEHLCLFDLERDPSERCNLAVDPDFSDVLREMRGRLAKARVAHGGPLLGSEKRAFAIAK